MTAVLAQSVALHARARAFVSAFERGAPMPEAFDALACDLARFQAENVAGYGRLCAARNVHIASIASAAEAPAVPTDAFKVARVSAFSESETPIVFRTSGTTIGTRGAHWFRTCETYDACALAFGRASLRAAEKMPVLVIGPPIEEQPDSSLGHMIARFASELGTPASAEETYFVRDGVIDLAALDERVVKLLYTGVRDVIVLGTSLAYVHLLDALDEARFRLPEGARVMQTGGFKGKSREVDAPKLRRDLARALCLEESAIIGEYGMTELSSQFWETTRDVYSEPPWARVVPVDPETLAPVGDGEIGIARIEDLANVDSAFAIVTADRVRRVSGGFELVGRAEGATPRGCSIATDEMMSR